MIMHAQLLWIKKKKEGKIWPFRGKAVPLQPRFTEAGGRNDNKRDFCVLRLWRNW